MPPMILQLNTSPGGVPKLAVRQATVDALGLAGDRHNDTVHHGGPEAALCLYSLEVIQALQAEGHPIFPGSVGENLTISGLDWEQVAPGARLQLGDQVLIEISGYTTPCETIAGSFRDGLFKRISHKLNPGWSRVYARVLTPGELRVGMPVTLLPAINSAD